MVRPERKLLVEKMNQFGRMRRPFLFIAGYDEKLNHISELDKIPEGIKFSTPWNPDNESYHPGREVLLDPHPLSMEKYGEAFDIVIRNIEHGNSYLLNLTFATPVDFNGTLEDIYKAATAPYKLLMPGEFVLFSPEIFVRIEDGKISGFPMKGTIDASLKDAEAIILNDEKEKAEHNTIIDLIRNDLSIVSNNVIVERYRYIDTIKSRGRKLLQVSSMISGTLDQGWESKLGDIICTMLPAGSVTGAPKEETCRIIGEAEGYERGWYTGVFGVFDGVRLDSGVMIRFLEESEKGFFYKSGGGITYLSDPEKEYNEMISKIYVPII